MPRSSAWERGSGLLQTDEVFVPLVSSRRKVARVKVTTLPDGQRVTEAQDFELRENRWEAVGSTYAWQREPNHLKHTLNSGEHLLSLDASHDASMEGDGHLRVRESGSRRIVWQTGPLSASTRKGFLLLQNGNLQVCVGRTDAYSVLWSSQSHGVDAYLELNDRGELRIYAPDCVWGSHGCYVNWRSAQNALRVTVRRLFEKTALQPSTSDYFWSWFEYFFG